MTDNIIFISGIGTNVGKSYATGWLANMLAAQGKNVMTQKLIQTGNTDMSEDITVHRHIMHTGYNEYDQRHITSPVILSYPASPHLAAAIDHISIDFAKINNATETLASIFDVVLVEGAGGLMVPLTKTYLTIDYIQDRHYPFEALAAHNIPLRYVIYNPYFDEDPVIAADNKEFMREYFSAHSQSTQFLVMPQTL